MEGEMMITLMIIMCFVLFWFLFVVSSGLKTKFKELFTDKFRVVRVCSFLHIMHYYLFCSFFFHLHLI